MYFFALLALRVCAGLVAGMNFKDGFAFSFFCVVLGLGLGLGSRRSCSACLIRRLALVGMFWNGRRSLMLGLG